MRKKIQIEKKMLVIILYICLKQTILFKNIFAFLKVIKIFQMPYPVYFIKSYILYIYIIKF